MVESASRIPVSPAAPRATTTSGHWLTLKTANGPTRSSSAWAMARSALSGYAIGTVTSRAMSSSPQCSAALGRETSGQGNVWWLSSG